MASARAEAERAAVVSHAPFEAPTILVFDSGMGGLSVLREIARARPDAAFVYAADDAGFPYGALGDRELVARVNAVIDALVAQIRPTLAVIACNTASTLALPSLRAHHQDLPFVGTVPAVKPACAGSASRRVSILATPGTVRRDYTADLVRQFASGCDVTLVPSARLAGLTEAALAGAAVDDAEIAAEIAPCFVDADGRRTDTVVLACTHYPLILDRLRRASPWPVEFIDPAPAIARRVVHLAGERAAPVPLVPRRPATPVQLLSTLRPLSADLVGAILGRAVAPPGLFAPALEAVS